MAVGAPLRLTRVQAASYDTAAEGLCSMERSTRTNRDFWLGSRRQTCKNEMGRCNER